MASPRPLYARLIRVRNGRINTDSIPSRVKSGLRKAVRTYALRIQAHIRMSMRMKKHGITYLIGGRKHVASAPGESPAILTGNLYRSIVPVYSPDGFSAKIAPKVHYGRYLEFGTKKLEPRPHLVPAFNEHRKAFRQDIQAIIQRL